mgnify:CR=1 FL=1
MNNYQIETTNEIIAYAIKYSTTAEKLKMAERVLRENDLTEEERTIILNCQRRLLKSAKA